MKTFNELFATLLGGHFKEKILIMADVQVSITINVAPAATPLTVDATGVPSNAQVGVPYSGAIKATGGVPPYTFTDTGKTLPVGLTLNADGTITGTPITAGSTTALIDVTDAAGAAVQAAVKTAVK